MVPGAYVRTATATDAMNALRRIVRALRLGERATREALGVTGAQLFVLRVLERSPAATVGELARRTASAQSSASEVIGRLTERGLVTRERSPLDRRRTEIALSEAGVDLLARGPETVQERLLGAFLTLSSERQQLLADGLAEWTSAAGVSDLPATMFFEPVAGDA